MTPKERKEYKLTRKLGACDKCKRNKAKCTHLTDMAKHINLDNETCEGTRKRSSPAFRNQDEARKRPKDDLQVVGVNGQTHTTRDSSLGIKHSGVENQPSQGHTPTIASVETGWIREMNDSQSIARSADSISGHLHYSRSTTPTPALAPEAQKHTTNTSTSPATVKKEYSLEIQR
ncbi:hypothetical protein BU24DRAFT_425088 [Aaosphaeria arxii CBS 175.79]|uniref:Zn(2)-C6 fungal-type domain-containing protein n=1 Tax=Aaosphaeria arxii CBS 175.79 TaxID=1450172 RepID=A0A6A5XHT8_9PLEO|nr:uncharacterized protein BU24DRAFT_425088 [Aaosphaeria arxii CBS 175.79]KAF2012426.1 hypothetical protein BU24DRAFT_425088 [Aaosphaeria arxii CBS 175.79]